MDLEMLSLKNLVEEINTRFDMLSLKKVDVTAGCMAAQSVLGGKRHQERARKYMRQRLRTCIDIVDVSTSSKDSDFEYLSIDALQELLKNEVVATASDSDTPESALGKSAPAEKRDSLSPRRISSRDTFSPRQSRKSLLQQDHWHQVGELSGAELSDGGDVTRASLIERLKKHLENVKFVWIAVDLKGHDSDVTCASWTADDAVIATCSYDKKVILWEAKKMTYTPFRTLGGHTDRVWSVAFSSDSRFLISGSADMTAQIWDVATFSKVVTLNGHNGDLWSCAFSPTIEGNIVTASQDGTARVWKASHRQPIAYIEPAPDTADGIVAKMKFVALNKKGTLMACATSKGAMLQQMSDPTIRHALARVEVNEVCFSPDGCFVATACVDGRALIWSTADTTACVAVVDGHGGTSLNTVHFENGAGELLLVTAGDDNVAVVWKCVVDEDAAGSTNLKSMHCEELTRLVYHDKVTCAALSPTGDSVITGSADTRALLWDCRNGQEKGAFSSDRGHDRGLLCVAFSPTGDRVVTGDEIGVAIVWGSEQFELLMRIQGHTSRLNSIAWKSDGKQMVTTSWDATATVWDMDKDGANEYDKLVTLSGHTQRVTNALFSSDGQRVLTSSEDGSVCLCEWNDATFSLAVLRRLSLSHALIKLTQVFPLFYLLSDCHTHSKGHLGRSTANQRCHFSQRNH